MDISKHLYCENCKEEDFCYKYCNKLRLNKENRIVNKIHRRYRSIYTYYYNPQHLNVHRVKLLNDLPQTRVINNDHNLNIQYININPTNLFENGTQIPVCTNLKNIYDISEVILLDLVTDYSYYI